MDPEAAVDRLQDLTQDAEQLLDGARKAPTKGIARERHRDARDALDEAGEVWDGLAQWVARGGWKPRRMDTWTDRYRKAEQEWSRQGKALR